MAKAKKLVPASRRTEEKERRRAELLEAAAHLITERGLDKLSFGDLALATGLSRPLIYFYFTDKDALYREAVCESHRRLHGRFVEATRVHHTGLEQVNAMGRSYVDYYRTEPHWFFLCAAYEAQPDAQGTMDQHGEQILQHKRGVMMVIEGALDKGIRDGSIRPDIGDLKIVGLNLWAFSLGLIQTAGAKVHEIEVISGVDSEAMMEQGFVFLRYMLAAKP
jgi:AcrR family transcriptional regulator